VKRHGKVLIAELVKLGFEYIWTNASGGHCYAHPGDRAQTEIIVNPSTDERGARAILTRARKLAGTTAVPVDKRNPQQIKERAAAARQRLADSRAARERLLQQKANTAAITRAERLVEQRERELAAIEHLMHQPPAGGNTHRGTGQPRHYTGPPTT
jgi:multidrug efflux pump subunit AcrA (membrane-fusion protein)